MSLIVNPSASINWTLTRERLCDKALEKCDRLGVGETVSAADRNLCLEALDAVLKNLLWRGYAWPVTASSSTALTFSSGIQSQALPQDFYSDEMLNYIDASGSENSLGPSTPMQWDSIPLKSTQARYPLQYYIDNFNTLWLYPIPNATLTLKLYYQKVIANSSAQTSLGLDSPWLLGIPYGIAAEIGNEFGVDPKRIIGFEQKWERQLQLGIMNEAPPGPDRMTVSD